MLMSMHRLLLMMVGRMSGRRRRHGGAHGGLVRMEGWVCLRRHRWRYLLMLILHRHLIRLGGLSCGGAGRVPVLRRRLRGDGRWHREWLETAVVALNQVRRLVARQSLVLAAVPKRSAGVEERATMWDRRIGYRVMWSIRSVLGGGKENPSLRGLRI